jgi:peptide/nickel transport system permease protein
VLAITLRWLPAGGHAGASAGLGRAAAHLLLPAATLALAILPVLLCAIRDGTQAARAERHLLLARAFGASPRALAWGRMLRLGLATALTPHASLVAQALSGVILVEAIFDLPGLGRLVIESVAARDHILLRGLALIGTATVVSAGFAGDVLRGLLDRRLRAAP